MPARVTKDGMSRSEKWSARRRTIVDTSAQVFAQRGYHATGVNDLCTANQLGKGGLYHYIESKEDVLAAIHDRVMDQVMLSVDRAAAMEASPTDQLITLGDELLSIITKYPHHVWVFLHEFPALTGERAKRFRQRRREYEKRIEAVIQSGIDSGEFLNVDPHLTTMAWLGMHNYTYLWLKPGTNLTANDTATFFAELFIRSVSSTSPRAELADHSPAIS